MQILWQPLINLLIVFYHLLFNNLGLAIIALTLLIRFLLVPLTLPSLKAMQKMRDLAPELEKIKKRHGKDRAKMMQAQADFYREKGINPAAGCLPQIVQIIILIALFNGFLSVLAANGNITTRLNEVLYPSLKLEQEVSTHFLSRDLTRPDTLPVPGLPLPLPGPFLVLAALVQFVSSKMMAPQTKTFKKQAKKTPGEMDDLMAGMQEQMLYLFPLMTLVIGYTFPLGLVIYWAVFSLFQAVQQYMISGWGGLASWVKPLGLVESGESNGRKTTRGN